MSSLLSGLKDSQIRHAVEVMHNLAACSTGTSSFVTGALEHLPSLVPSDLTTLSLCDLKNGTRKVFGRQAEALSKEDRAAFDLHFREHPLVRFHGSRPHGPTQRITDCMSARAFRNSGLYADYYARLGIGHVMALPLRIDEGTVVSIVLNRSGSNFLDAERAVFEVIRPQLSALFRNLVALEEAEAGFGRLQTLAAGNGWQMVRIDRSGRMLGPEPAALRLLRRYFATQDTGARAALPASLAAWLSRSRNWGFDRPAECGQPFAVTRSGMRLTVHFVPDPTGGDRFYLLMKEAPAGIAPARLARLPLTLREREVLALVAAGKSNPEIGTLLGIGARTVQKHLEHVFDKLGVENRTAAAVLALSAMACETGA